MERTQISITREQLKRLRSLARRRKKSMAGLIREAVDQVYPPLADDDKWAAALGAVGGFHSGRADVSEEHDRELTDAFAE